MTTQFVVEWRPKRPRKGLDGKPVRMVQHGPYPTREDAERAKWYLETAHKGTATVKEQTA